MEALVSLKQVTKNFGQTQALTDVSFNLYPGEVLGFIGPNGAGKSTTIRIMLGLLKKTSGQATLFGHDAWHDSLLIHKHLAYLPGDLNLWENLTGQQVIDLLLSLHPQVDYAKKDALITKFKLDPNKKIKSYSKGNRQKVGLIATLAVNCDFYIFDEPTSGLDPLMEQLFQAEVQALKQAGKTVLLSSHILSEVESLADRIVIIRSGRIIDSGKLQELRHLTRNKVTLTLTSSCSFLANLPFIYDLSLQTDNQATFNIDSQQINSLLAALAQHKVVQLEITPPNLEEVFISHYQS